MCRGAEVLYAYIFLLCWKSAEKSRSRFCCCLSSVTNRQPLPLLPSLLVYLRGIKPHTSASVCNNSAEGRGRARECVLCCCVYARREETPAHVVQLKLEERRRQRRENLLTFRNTFRFTQSREKRARRRTFSFRVKGRPMRAQLSLHRQRCRHSYTARKVNEMSNFNLSIELHDIPWNEFHTTTSIHSVEARTCSETTSRSKQKQKYTKL